MKRRIIKRRKSVKRIRYPTVSEIVRSNKRVLQLHKVTKAEKHELLKSRHQIQKEINRVKSKKGDVYMKSAILMKTINQGHFFGSANKRTSYLVMNNFLYKNKDFALLKKKNKRNLGMMRKIRQKRVSDENIRKWLRNKKN